MGGDDCRSGGFCEVQHLGEPPSGVVLVEANLALRRCLLREAHAARDRQAPLAPDGAPRARSGKICRHIGDHGDSLAEVTMAFGVGWHTAAAAVFDHDALITH